MSKSRESYLLSISKAQLVIGQKYQLSKHSFASILFNFIFLFLLAMFQCK